MHGEYPPCTRATRHENHTLQRKSSELRCTNVGGCEEVEGGHRRRPSSERGRADGPTVNLQHAASDAQNEEDCEHHQTSCLPAADEFGSCECSRECSRCKRACRLRAEIGADSVTGIEPRRHCGLLSQADLWTWTRELTDGKCPIRRHGRCCGSGYRELGHMVPIGHASLLLVQAAYEEMQGERGHFKKSRRQMRYRGSSSSPGERIRLSHRCSSCFRFDTSPLPRVKVFNMLDHLRWVGPGGRCLHPSL